MLWSTRCTAPSEARAAFVAAPTAARRPPPSGFCFPRGAHGRHQHLSSRRRRTGTPHTCPWLLRRHRPLLGAFARPLEMPFCDSAAPPRLDCSACALPHDRLARARAGSPSRCSSLRPPPLLFAACQGSRLVDVVGLSASHVQCSSAGCDACVRFPTDSACSAKVSLRRPRVRVRSSSPSVESVRRVRSSGPLVVFSSTSCLAWLSSHCAPTYMVTFLDVSVCDLADLACVGQTSAAAGRMRFRASLFRRYSGLDASCAPARRCLALLRGFRPLAGLFGSASVQRVSQRLDFLLRTEAEHGHAFWRLCFALNAARAACFPPLAGVLGRKTYEG